MDYLSARLWDLWCWAAGVEEPDGHHEKVEHQEAQREAWELLADTWIKMYNRIVMGRYRYGALRGYEQVHTTERCIAGMRRLIERYEQTGNTEILVDVANYAAIERVYSTHPNKHWRAEDDGEHVGQNVRRET